MGKKCLLKSHKTFITASYPILSSYTNQSTNNFTRHIFTLSSLYLEISDLLKEKYQSCLKRNYHYGLCKEAVHYLSWKYKSSTNPFLNHQTPAILVKLFVLLREERRVMSTKIFLWFLQTFTSSGLFFSCKVGKSSCHFRGIWFVFYTEVLLFNANSRANSVDPNLFYGMLGNEGCEAVTSVFVSWMKWKWYKFLFMGS